MGYDIWCDTMVQCGHEDRTSKVQFWLTEDMPQTRDDVKAEDIKRTDKLCADIGCGLYSEYWEGTLMRYDLDESVKPDICCDVRQIPEPPEKFDEVRARHVLEHFRDYEAPALVAEWLRILKVGGTMRVSVPNLEWAMETILKKQRDEPIGDEDLRYAWGVVYGSDDPEYQGKPGMEHRNGYTVRSLKNLFAQVGGMGDVVVEKTRNDTEVEVSATKTEHVEPQALLEWWNKGREDAEEQQPEATEPPQEEPRHEAAD